MIATRLFAVISFCVCVSFAGTAFSQGTVFRWKLTPGLKLISEVTQDVEQGVPGTTAPITQDIKLRQLWEVLSNNADSSARMATTLEHAELTMKLPGVGEVAMNTSQPADEEKGFSEQIGKMFRPMIGVPCENDMLPTGKVSNVSIPDAALEGFRNVPNGSAMESVLVDSIEKGSPVFPDEAIAPGHVWTQTHSTKTPMGSLQSTNTIRYIGAENIDGRLLHRFDISLHLDFPAKEGAEQTIKVTEQNAEGTLWFDNDAGYLVSSEIRQNLSMSIKTGQLSQSESALKQTMRTTFTPANNRP